MSMEEYDNTKITFTPNIKKDIYTQVKEQTIKYGYRTKDIDSYEWINKVVIHINRKI